MKLEKLFYVLNVVTIVFVLIVIILGAYTRLSHAGLGCPDWPGCYGRLVISENISFEEEAKQLYPDRPLEQGKAWKEMVHRYAAAGLGLLILVMSIIAWNNRNTTGQQLWVPILLLGLVVFQALLGMWTVTLLLKPIVVMGHLLGGMTLLLLLVWQLLVQKFKRKHNAEVQQTSKIYPWAIFAIVVLYMQISLGGWTSANYAALACPDLPTCQGEWWPKMDFKEGFVPWRGLGVDYEHGVLNMDARKAIHFSHRIGAVLTLFIIGTVAVSAMRSSHQRVRKIGAMVVTVLLVQFGLGIVNILYMIPIFVAVAHNAVASLLLSSLGMLLFFSKNTGYEGA